MGLFRQNDEEKKLPENAEAQEEANVPEESGNRQTLGAFIRILAGGYVAYLGYQAIRDSIASGAGKWYLYLISAVLIGAGAFFIIMSVKQLMTISRKQKEEQERMASDPEYRRRAEELQSRELPTRTMTEGSATGADIRARLQALNEEDGLEIETITSEEKPKEE